MSDLIISGINLMLTGMVTVLIFLSILILLINISASLFKEELIDNSKENLAKRLVMSDLIISGINLMLTGMVTVLIFLSILILLINISASLFKDELIDSSKENLAKSPDVNKLKIEHKEIINIIKKRIFNE